MVTPQAPNVQLSTCYKCDNCLSEVVLGLVMEVVHVRSTVFVSFTTPRRSAWAVERLNNLSLEHQLSQPLQVFLLGAGQDLVVIEK